MLQLNYGTGAWQISTMPPTFKVINEMMYTIIIVINIKQKTNHNMAFHIKYFSTKDLSNVQI